MQKLDNIKPVIKINDSPPPLIPEGIYEGILLHYEFANYRGGKKLYLTFVIQAQGTEYHGFPITRIYNWYERETSRNNAFKLDCERVLRRRLNFGEDASIEILEKNVLQLKIRTVTHNWKKEELPAFHKYSVIDSILGVAREKMKDDICF